MLIIIAAIFESFFRSLSNMCERPSDPKLLHQRYCVEKMFGLTVGLDCLTRYNDRVRDDACALNMMATLLERQNLIGPARKALLTAQKIVERKQDENFDSVHLNLGR